MFPQGEHTRVRPGGSRTRQGQPTELLRLALAAPGAFYRITLRMGRGLKAVPQTRALMIAD